MLSLGGGAHVLQVLHMYLEDDSIAVDNDTALKLGCLEIRRFFRDTSEQALRKKKNIEMLEYVFC